VLLHIYFTTAAIDIIAVRERLEKCCLKQRGEAQIAGTYIAAAVHSLRRL